MESKMSSFSKNKQKYVHKMNSYEVVICFVCPIPKEVFRE